MTSPLISTADLAGLLYQDNVAILDGSWYMPADKRDPKAEYAAQHIPGAVFFDIDGIRDTASPYPHMLPSAEIFAAAVGALGISNAHKVIVYDGAGLFSAARVWWMFKVFGYDNVAVLDGGLPKWIAEGRPVTSDAETPEAALFSATLRPALLRTVAQMQANLAHPGALVVDARSNARFTAQEPEPRAGMRSGHIPGSKNIPYKALLNADGTVKDPAALKATFVAAGVKENAPVITSCGSGVTASILALGLELTGHRAWSLYDGSWAEWGAEANAGECPVAR
ncbi:MAG: 3-mercaptopyruvate sulfurtransferase [Alphaproteobacteria bacterium]|nr:3-mercaptopyruvate sulfurtransferase [Alphaproteobacteria bacterium]